MSKQIDYIPLWLASSDQDILAYPYSLEAYDHGKPSGGCRTKNKEDLRSMYQIWKETYGTIELKYIFKKGEKVIEL